MPDHPREAKPLVSWWLDPELYANVKAHRQRWQTSKLAEMTVPKGSVPVLDLKFDKRGVITTQR